MAAHLNDSRRNETEDFRFYRVPKALFNEELSLEAVMLYSLMLDRADLSARNGWTDRQGRIYIYFTQKDVQKRLRCGHNRATAFMRELERSGLIERKRQGLGKPAMIYVNPLPAGENAGASAPETARNHPDQHNEKPAPSPAQTQAVQNLPGGPSGMPVTGAAECPSQAANDTEKKETEFSETNPILPQPPQLFGKPSPPRKTEAAWMDETRWIREEIRENIDYEGLVLTHPGNQEILDGYIELMTETACSPNDTVRVCGREIPTAAVRRRFLELERAHIEYVRDCLRNHSRPIGNIKAYTLAALYNAPLTMESYYDALVCRDLSL